MKTIENKGLLTVLNSMGRGVPLKPPSRFQIVNKIKGFAHISYGECYEIQNVNLGKTGVFAIF